MNSLIATSNPSLGSLATTIFSSSIPSSMEYHLTGLISDNWMLSQHIGHFRNLRLAPRNPVATSSLAKYRIKQGRHAMCPQRAIRGATGASERQIGHAIL